MKSSAVSKSSVIPWTTVRISLVAVTEMVVSAVPPSAVGKSTNSRPLSRPVRSGPSTKSVSRSVGARVALE